MEIPRTKLSEIDQDLLLRKKVVSMATDLFNEILERSGKPPTKLMKNQIIARLYRAAKYGEISETYHIGLNQE